MIKTVVLMCGSRKRTYPLPNGVELQDAYILDGERWVVVAVVPVSESFLEVPVAQVVDRDAGKSEISRHA